jgi:hypothetical protein
VHGGRNAIPREAVVPLDDFANLTTYAARAGLVAKPQCHAAIFQRGLHKACVAGCAGGGDVTVEALLPAVDIEDFHASIL